MAGRSGGSGLRVGVVRLNTKSGVKFFDREGEEIPLLIEKGEERQMEGVYYPGGTRR